MGRLIGLKQKMVLRGARDVQLEVSGKWDNEKEVYLPFAITNFDDVQAFKELEFLSVIAVGLEDIRGILDLKKILMLGLKPSCDFASIGELSQVKDPSIRPRHTVEFSLAKFWKHPSLVRLAVVPCCEPPPCPDAKIAGPRFASPAKPLKR